MQVDRLNKAIFTSVAGTEALSGNVTKVNPRGYAQLTRQLKTYSSTFRDAAASTGMFEVQQIKINSATEEYTKALEKQKVSFRGWKKNQDIAKRAYREQLALQAMFAQKVPGSVGGKGLFDIAIPTTVAKDMDSFGNKVGWLREQVRSASTEMVNWGKNTQWAGRQLMVGFTVPTAAFAAGTAILAFQIDKQMTRIQKVYDTTAQVISGSTKEMTAVERELAQVRQASMATALNAAKQYGASANDTLDVQAQLAATGKKGAELQKATNEVMRIATLGEIDHATALNATIAMQSVFKMNTDQLAKSFNYMNSVENATSLGLADFAAAIPIASAPIKMMGGDIHTLGLLLTAMKERGIDAVEGANAIKAAMNRLSRPGKQIQQEFKAITDASIIDIRDRNKGNLVGMLTEIADVTKDLNKSQKQQVFSGLFGTYQVTRFAAMLDGLEDLKNGVGQVSDAYRIGQQSATKWADTADMEMQRFHESISGQFTTALRTMQIELANMGTPFLQWGTMAVKALSTVVERFNALPNAAKRVLALGAILMAVVGPFIMLVGLAANFTGNMLKMAVAITSGLTKFELLNKETAAAKLANKFATVGFTTTEDAIAKLTEQVDLLTMSYKAATREAMLSSAAFTGDDTVIASQGRHAKGYVAPVVARPPKHRADTKHKFQVPDEAVLTMEDVDKSAEVAKNTGKTHNALRASAVSGALLAGSFGAMMFSSNETVDNIAQIAMMSALIGPALWPVIKGLRDVEWAKWGKAISTGVVGGFNKAKKAVTGVVTATVAMRASGMSWAKIMGKGALSLGAMAGPIGIITVGLAAAATAGFLLYKHSKKAADELHRAYDNAAPIAKILGYEPVSRTDVQNQNPLIKQQNDVKAVADAYPELIDRIKEANTDQDKLNEAMHLGLNVIQTGGTAKQAEQAVKTAMIAASNEATATRIMLRFKGQIDFDDPAGLAESARIAAQQALDIARKSAGGPGASGPGAARMASTNIHSGISREAKEALKQLGEQSAEVYTNGFAQYHNAMPFVSMVDNLLKQTDKDIADASGAQKAKLEETRAEMIKQIVEANAGKEAADGLSKDWLKTADAMEIVNHTYYDVNRAQRISFLQSKKDAGTINDDQQTRLDNLLKEQDAQKISNNLFSKNKTVIGETLPPLALAGGLVESMAGAAGKSATGFDKAAAAAKRAAFAAADFAGGYKNAVSNTNDEIAAIANSNFDIKMNANLDAMRADGERRQESLERRQERATSRFESQWEKRKKTASDFYDARIKGINDAIEAEEKAEDTRKRIFDAEIQRMQRLSEMQNSNIDFNVAVNSGSLDEAAKIHNDMVAKEAEWALSDAGDVASQQSEARKEKMQRKADKLDKRKDKRLEALDKLEKKEREALERRQANQKKFLDAEVADNIAAQQEIWNSRKETLQNALELLKNYVPKSEADLKRHVDRIADKYKDFNVDTKGEFNVTAVDIGKMLTKNIKDSARAIKSEVQWAGIGNEVAQEMIQGAFGMTPQDFKKWMVTGKWPKDSTPPTAEEIRNGTKNARQRKVDQQLGHETQHDGGMIGNGANNRTGYARTAPISKRERMVLAESGEFMVNKNSASKYPDLLNAINNDEVGPKFGVGGPGPVGMGITGLMGALIARAAKSTVESGIVNGAVGAVTKGAGAAAGASAGAGGISTYTPGQGGWRKPAPPGLGWANSHDYRAPLGTPLFAVSDGTIVDSRSITSGGSPGNGKYATPYRSYGETVAMRTASGDIFRYAHLTPGTRIGLGAVKGGTMIGRSGQTGNATGPHVHFDVNGDYNAREWLAAHAVSLKKGASNVRWDNTIANLHRGEGVLTEDINTQFRQGVKNFANGGSAVYNVNMTINGNDLDADEIVNKTVVTLKRLEKRKPQSRHSDR